MLKYYLFRNRYSSLYIHNRNTSVQPAFKPWGKKKIQQLRKLIFWAMSVLPISMSDYWANFLQHRWGCAHISWTLNKWNYILVFVIWKLIRYGTIHFRNVTLNLFFESLVNKENTFTYCFGKGWTGKSEYNVILLSSFTS